MFNNKSILITGGTGSFGKNFVRYVLRSTLVCVQFRYNHEAVTSFPTSNTDPIIITGQNAPGNIVASPITE